MTDGSTGNNTRTTVDGTALINNNDNTDSTTVVQRQLLIRDDCGPQRSLTSRTMSISTSSGVLDSPTVIVTVAVATSTSTDGGNDDSDNFEIDDPLQNESPMQEMTTARATDSNTANFGRPLRYDEQACEAHYDERDDADDDIEKGKIRFPQHVLFGRERESKQLNDVLESSIRQESLHIVFLEGVSGVGKSALVWESLLYGDGEGDDVDVDVLVDKSNTKRNRSSSSSRIRRRRPCWIASGKYNHHSTTQPFTAIVQSLELLASSIVAEATKALEETDGFQDQPIVTISHRFTSWYDSDDAATLISFCPSIELVQAALKKVYKRSRSTSQRHHRHRNRTENWMNNINYKHECRLSPKPSVLQRRSTGGSSQNHSDNNSSRDISETSSLLSEDESNSATDQSSLAATNDIQQLALALKSFLHCLTMPSRPLIWFLDDLQWADDCSVQLIQNILVTSSTSTTSGPNDEKEAIEEGNQLLSHSETLEKDLVIMLNGQKTNNPIIGLFVGAYRPISSFKANDSRQPPSDHHDKVTSNHSEQKENNGETSLQNMLDSVTKAVPTTLTMRVTNLTPKAIVDFCCTTLDIEEEEGWPLTNALYSATMGNIFHCRQALEHLVRNNFLYYDVMFFSWSYNLPEDGSVLQDVVEKSCQDVLELVQSKLQSCSELVRAILIRAAYTENTVFGAMLLLSLLQATGYPELTQSHMREALDEATDEGVLLNITWGSPSSGEEYDGVAYHPFHSLRYKFSHDKVKEAAYNLLPKCGHEREKVLLPLSTVLIQWALQASPSSAVSTDRQPSDGGLTSVPYIVSKPVSPSANQDWMWFVGVQHLNSIPIESILGTASDSFQVSKSFTLPSIEINRKRLAQWNMRVAELSIAHSSYKEAIKFLKAAISCLEPDEMWRVDGPYYKLSLQLYNKLMEISVAQGEFEETKDAIAIVMTKAGSLYDKIIAFSTKIQLAVKLNDRNVEFGIKESLNVLPLFGIKIPSQPSAVDVVLERMKFKMELQGRPLSVMGELDLILPRDPKGDLMMLLAELFHMLLLAKNHQYSYLTEIVALRGMRWTLENGISQRFPLLLSYYSAPLRSKGELNAAGKYAAIVKRLFQRFAEESGSSIIRSSEFLFCEFILHAGMLPLQNHPFEDSLENFIDIYRHSLARGAADSAMSSAMHYPLTYFVCGRPLNALLDAKLVLFQDKALQLQMPGYVALFYCARQVLYNLQGKNHGSAATAIPGETQVLSTLEGRMKNMTERDFAIYRMVLAVIFGDLDCMEKLMNCLEDIPLFDLSFARQILRVTFCGLAAYLLVRDGRSPKKNLKIASEIVKDLKKLDRADGSSSREAGSVNFRPIVLCLAALEANTVAKYDIAIAACGKRQLLHLQALMCEQAGLLCLSRSNLASPIGVKTRKTTRKRDSDPNQEQTTNTATKGVGSLTMVSTEIEEANLGRQFLGKAMWLYQDWNATAKVCQLKQRFPFLKNLTRRAAGIMPSSASSIGSLYSNESVRSKSQGTRPSTYFPVENHLGRSSECDSIYTAESNQD